MQFSKMIFSRGFCLGLLILILPLHSLAQSTVINKISVEGNRRVERDAVLNQIKLKSGEPYSTELVRKSIQDIYSLGFFENIEVDSTRDAQGINLVFRVQEKPSIRKINYEGYKKVDLADIKAVVDIKEYSILSLHKITESKEKIVKMYEQKGFFLAEVKQTLLEDKKANEVELTFQIEELDKVKVRKITFIGNLALTSSDLKSVMATKEGGLFSWLTKSDSFQEEVFRGDLGNLDYFYNTKGYAKVKIDPPIVTVSANKKWIYISISIAEGDMYSVGKIEYAGDLIFDKDHLHQDHKIEPGSIFNIDDLHREVTRLADLYKDEGYAFANVNVKSDTREKEKKVNIVFDFEKGQKVYFGNINIVGNTNTRDKVVRRELKVYEGELYNETKLRKSIDRVRALGYFSEVTYTKPQGSSLDVLNLEISVKERSTGALTVGAGWSSVDAFIANAQISHSNLFGRGHEVALNAQIATGANGTNTFSSSFTEPYTFDTLWSSGFDAYNIKTGTTNFDEHKTGGDFRIGHPIGESMNTYSTYKLENVRLSNVTTQDPNILSVKGGLISSIIGTFVLDKRDDRARTTKGFYESLSSEYAGLGGDSHFSKSILRSRFYYPGYLDGVFRVNMEMGALFRTTSDLAPSTERFYLGGVNSLRGFTPFSVSPSAISSDNKFVLTGGDREFFTNFEYEIPLVSSMGIKSVLFYDVGSAFNGMDMGRIRNDYGFGFRWFSPFGPLRVEVGFPVRPKEDEKKQVLQFAITPPF